MMKHAWKWGLVLTTTVLLAGVGCGPSAPAVSSSDQEVQVKGTVTINGKPASGGEIQFDPANINRKDAVAQSFPIGEDGTYSGTSLVGENSVSVSGPQIDPGSELGMNREVVTLQSGENTVDITLP